MVEERKFFFVFLFFVDIFFEGVSESIDKDNRLTHIWATTRENVPSDKLLTFSKICFI